MKISLKDKIQKNQIYDGPIVVSKMFEHLLRQKIIYCSRGRIYLYDKDEGRYILIEDYAEWHYISLFFSNEICISIPIKSINEILKRLKHCMSIQIAVDEFNKREDLINVKNGVLEYKTGRLLEKNQSYKFTYCLNVEYLPNSSIENAPRFKRFCETSLQGDEQKIELLLQFLGYILSPLICAKKALVLLGQPNSGKSLILHLIEFILGNDFISNISLENLGQRFKTAVLSTKLLNICGELSAKPLKDIEVFKMVVGGDTLSAEFKGKNEFEFKNKCKLMFAGNILPPIKNEDISTAFVDRLAVLRFNNSIPEKARNHTLAKEIEKEADVIFSLSINALNKLINDNYVFAIPEDTHNLLKGYSFQQTNIDVFVEDWCVIDGQLKIHSSTLYAAYKKFCVENAISPISQNLFSQKIASVSGVKNGKFRLCGSNPARGFYGIGLKNKNTQVSEMCDSTD